MGTRQTLNVPGIKYENIEACNKKIQEYIKDVDVEPGIVSMTVVKSSASFSGIYLLFLYFLNSSTIFSFDITSFDK